LKIILLFCSCLTIWFCLLCNISFGYKGLLDPSVCVNNPCTYKLEGKVYYTNTAAISSDDLTRAVKIYLQEKLPLSDYLVQGTTISITIAEADTDVTEQNMDYVNQSGYAYWVPPLLAMIFVSAAIYFIREKKSKMTNHRHSLDEEGEDSNDNDLVYTKGCGFPVANPISISSPMLVTKKSNVGGSARIKQGRDSGKKYSQLECRDLSFDMCPLADIDTNVSDFALRKRTPTKVSANNSYLFPVQYDDSTNTFDITGPSKKTRSASKRNGYPYQNNSDGKEKLLHEWNLEFNGRSLKDTMEL
jgi:hypothetical protein